MSSIFETEEAKKSVDFVQLNTPLSLFNGTNLTLDSSSSDIAIPLKFRRSIQCSKSIDLKSFIESDDYTNHSDLWDMQSIHTSFACFDVEEETKAMKEESPKHKLNETNSEKMTLSPILAVERDRFQRFHHIETKQVPSFEMFARNETNLEFIYFSGSSAPMCTFQTMQPSDKRQYYRMLIPPCYEDQDVFLLCCRKKKFLDKYRFSTNEFQIKKRNNPNYIGKMKVVESQKNNYVKFRISMKNQENICLISIHVHPENKTHLCEVQLFKNKNVIESNEAVFTGTINHFVAPKLDLSVSSSNRTILNITDCESCIENVLKQRTAKESHISNVQNIDFDYPLSIFLSFAIVCAVNCRHDYI